MGKKNKCGIGITILWIIVWILIIVIEFMAFLFHPLLVVWVKLRSRICTWKGKNHDD